MPARLAFVVAGPAGSGKSTLARALATRTGAVLLDQDVLTNALLDGLAEGAGLIGHWNDPQHRSWVRPARYAALRAVAADQVRLGRDVVLVAPFTAELGGGEEWHLLRAALAPAETSVLWLDAPASVLAARLQERGEPRDRRWASPEPATQLDAPRVPHVRVDGTRPTVEQLAGVLGGWQEGAAGTTGA